MKMKIFSLLIGGLVFNSFLNVQAEISLFFQDLFPNEINPEYITNFEGFVHDNPEEGLFVNFTIIKTLPSGATGRFQLKGSSMGEYVVPTGIDYSMELCEMMEEPIILGRTLRCFGFREDDCPPSPGVYGTESYVLDLTTFPDEFPPNNYMLYFDIMDADDRKIISVNVLARVF